MTELLDRWDVTVPEAVAIQRRLKDGLVDHPPPGFAPRLVADADMSMEREGTRGYAGLVVIVVIDADTMETVDEATAEVDLTFPYVPGLLSFRELPAIAAAWKGLPR